VACCDGQVVGCCGKNVGPQSGVVGLGQYVATCGQLVLALTGQWVGSLTVHSVYKTGHSVRSSGHRVWACGQNVVTVGQAVALFGQAVTVDAPGHTVS
jgi:hypothetical protein